MELVNGFAACELMKSVDILSYYRFQLSCTLKLRKPPKSVEEFFELFFLQAPKEPFTLNLLSVYSLPDPDSCELLYKSELGRS